MSNPTEQVFHVPVPLMQAVAAYLSAQPYREVAPLMAELGQLQQWVAPTAEPEVAPDGQPDAPA